MNTFFLSAAAVGCCFRVQIKAADTRRMALCSRSELIQWCGLTLSLMMPSLRGKLTLDLPPGFTGIGVDICLVTGFLLRPLDYCFSWEIIVEIVMQTGTEVVGKICKCKIMYN